MAPDFKESELYLSQDEQNRDVLDNLIKTQLDQGNMLPLDGTVEYKIPSLTELAVRRKIAKAKAAGKATPVKTKKRKRVVKKEEKDEQKVEQVTKKKGYFQGRARGGFRGRR